MSPPFAPISVVILAVVALGGCAVGPHFLPPPSPAPTSYTASPLPAQTASAPTAGGAAQRFTGASELASQWWTLFRSPELDGLIHQGLAHSPSMAAAQATLRGAQEKLRAASGALFYPAVDADFHATRQRTSGVFYGGPSSEYNLYNASAKVSYTFDLFGGGARRMEALRAQIDYQRYQLEATYLALTANLVTSAIREASLRAQIEATHDLLAAERTRLVLVERQFTLGAVGRSSVLAQQTEVAKTRAALPPLERQLALTHHALAVLTGQLPSEGDLPRFRLDALTLPEVLPVILPSELAHQRPDIRAAEALLHQASAAVGVATANLYPRVTLAASYGSEVAKVGDLFSAPSMVWNLGAGLFQPLFRGGQLTAERRAAVAAYEQAAAQYQQTVLQAFQNVADVLWALDTDARTLQAQAEAEATAKATLELTQSQFDLGAVSYLALLLAERDYQQARIASIAAQAERYADTAALFQALGGGWLNRTPTTAGAAVEEVQKDGPVAAGSADRGGPK